MAPFDPPLTHGIREATGSERPAPGILCWNCRQLTPFPSGSCRGCGAAFAGTHGGVVPDCMPDQTVRAPLSVPTVTPPVRPRRRIVRHLADPAPMVESVPRETVVSRAITSIPASAPRREPRVVSQLGTPRPMTLPSKPAVLAECPVCGRTPSPAAQGCVCGAVFGDAMTTVNCAECGSVVPIETDRCFVCGVTFGGAGEATYSCPLCGAFVAEAASVCRCGARFAE